MHVLQGSLTEPPVTVRLKGLNASALYEVRVRGKEETFTATGALLMQADIPLPLEDPVKSARENGGSFRSVMLLLKRIRG